MAEPFLAEIRIVGFNFAPRGWAFCDGQFLPINQNQSLYSLLGTTYGGDGRTSFALPDLRGRTPLHVGNGHSLGARSGAETMTLTTAQIPSHDHVAKASSLPGNAREPSGALLAAEVAPDATYATVGAGTSRTLRAGTVTNVGGGQAHDNMQPFMAINFCIALQGLFPSRS